MSLRSQITAADDLAPRVQSLLIKALKSSGLLPTGVNPKTAKRSLISGLASALAISRLSAATISFGVPAGAKAPTH